MRGSDQVRLKLARLWRNPWANLTLRLSVVVVILALLSRRIDFVQVLNTLLRVDGRPLVLALVLQLAARYVWAYQTSLGLAPLNMRFGVFDLFRISLISSFYSLLLPGDLAAGSAAWYKLSRPQRKGIEAGALLVYFRLINTVTVLAIGLVGMWFDPRLASPGFRVVVGGMLMVVVLLLLPFFSPVVTRFFERLAGSLERHGWFGGWLPAELRAVWATLVAFQALSNLRTVTLILGLSLLAHALGIVNFYLFALAVGIDLPLAVIAWIRSAVAIIQMVPVSVGGLGVREASLVVLLRDYGIPQAEAMSFSLVIFGIIVASGIVGGLFEGWAWLAGGRQVTPAVPVRDIDPPS